MNFSRPTVLALLAVSLLNAKDPLAFIGTYTGEKSKGIYVAEFHEANGQLGKLTLAGEIKNPSFVAIHPNGKFLYAVTETGNGSVSAFALDPTSGALKSLNSVSSKGNGPCFVTVDKTGKNVLVANYGSGSVAVLPLNADGSLRESSSFIQHKGKGADPKRQDGPHAHSVNFAADNRFAIAADLGLDKVFVYKFDADKGTITPNDPPAFDTKPGAGPRHFSFAPDGKHAYVINELASTITALDWDGKKGILKEIETVSTLPADFKGTNSTAEVLVHPSGKFVYGSNRGHDSIVVFQVQTGGKLKAVQHIPTQGHVPRNFRIDPTGKYLIAANQNSDNLVVYGIDGTSGQLKANGSTGQVGSPVCIRFLERK